MESFNNIPTPFKALMALMTGTSILGVVSMIDAKLTGIVAVGMLILAALLAAFYFIVQFMERRKSTAMVGNIQQQAASIPTGVNDPARRARLEELRRSFDSGIDKFRSAGKDIYKLPWYLFVGDPGSGKSALLAKFCRELASQLSTLNPQHSTVLPHFIGASTGSTDLRRTLRRLCHELARASGCALLPVVIVRRADGYAARIFPELAYDRAAIGNRAGRVRLTAEIVRVFEPAIRQDASQWFHFVPVWPSPLPPV